MLEWFKFILLLILVFGPIIYLSWLLSMLLIQLHEHIKQSRFEKKLIRAVVHHQPSWVEVKALAKAQQLSPATALPVIRKVYSAILTSEAPSNNALAAQKELIWNYMMQYHRDEPFEGLPSEIHSPLMRLRDQLANHEHLLDPLTDKLKELLTLKSRENLRLKLLAVGSFVIGVAGLAFAAYPYFFP